MGKKAIIAEQLVKRYGDFEAVKAVGFTVESGEIFGFLGPNGAGKSTTVAMLTTLTTPSSGRALVGGFDVVRQAAEVRQMMGVALQEIGIDPLMTAEDLLRLQARLFGMSRKQAQQRALDLLELVKLTDAKTIKRPVGQYSGGMRRRLDLALALVHQPQILFLDEPTTGLDPASRRDVWTEVRRLNVQFGMTIFLTTQYLEEADELAHRVAIIDQGQIAVEGTPAQLKAQLGSESINITVITPEVAYQAQTVLTDISIVPPQLNNNMLRLYVKHASAAVAPVVNRLQSAGIPILALTLSQPSLDDVFLEVTGQRLQVKELPAETAR